MIRRDAHWGAGEWFVVLLWKATTLAIAGVMAYVGATEGTAGIVIASIYVPFGLGLFLFTQPDV